MDKVCKFCGSVGVTAYGFVPPLVKFIRAALPKDISVECPDWPACASCAELIDKRDRDALIVRAGSGSMETGVARIVIDTFFAGITGKRPL